MRGAATQLARAGYPTARLTLPGTADGAGGPRDAGLPHQWVDAVGAAAAWLREHTAASRCVAFGIGLGGMLAYLAAREHKTIDDLALWAVPDRGSTLLREGKSLSKVIASDFPEDQGRDTAGEGDLELIGLSDEPGDSGSAHRAAAELTRTPRLSSAPGAAAKPRRHPGRPAAAGQPRAPGR